MPRARLALMRLFLNLAILVLPRGERAILYEILILGTEAARARGTEEIR